MNSSIRFRSRAFVDYFPMWMLRINLTLMVTNCSDESSFTAMFRVQSYIRTSMSADCLNVLSLLCVECEVMHSIYFGEKNKDFADESPKSASEVK